MVPSSLVFFTLLFSSLQNQLLGMTVKTSRALRFTVFTALLAFLTLYLMNSMNFYFERPRRRDLTLWAFYFFIPLYLFGLYIPCYLLRAQVASLFIYTLRFVHYMHHGAV